MNKIIKNTILCSFIYILLGMNIANVYADDTNKVLVKGDGFTITKMDLDAENSLLSPQFQTTEDQIINAILRNRLFALEAKKKWNDPLINKKIEIMTEKYYGLLYNDKIEKSIQISDDVLKSYYIANPEEFIIEAEYNLNLLMVKHKVVCEKIKKDIDSGVKDFAKSVQEDSLDEETKEKEGSMGWMTEGRIPKEMWNYIAPLEKGQVSEPFMYGDNWFLVQVVDKKKGGEKDFEAAKAMIREKLIQKEYMKKLDEEFERLKKEYNVSVN
ncbi:MAG: peptidyl-prolyl cis-trans isomerase [Desulfamplus sp.]|nr:peptidyl-prolyl cis-trans isomerase [Desulfamplus sp.]